MPPHCPGSRERVLPVILPVSLIEGHGLSCPVARGPLPWLQDQPGGFKNLQVLRLHPRVQLCRWGWGSGNTDAPISVGTHLAIHHPRHGALTARHPCFPHTREVPTRTSAPLAPLPADPSSTLLLLVGRHTSPSCRGQSGEDPAKTPG